MAYSRAEVLAKRKCGLKFVDTAFASAGRQSIIDEAISISKSDPAIWGGGWSNVAWALGNAVINELNPNGDLVQTWNVDEVLTDDEMTYVASALNITEPYKPSWPRS